MKQSFQRGFLNWRGHAASIALIALVTLLMYVIRTASISIHAEVLYMPVVVLTALFFGIVSAIISSILSIMTFDYLFIAPLYTLGPRDAQNIPILIGFLTVGVIVSLLGIRLRESEMKFRSMVDTAHEGIAMVDPRANITYVNRRFLDMLGYSAGEMLGKSIVSFAGKDHAAELQQRLNNRKRGIGEGYEMAYRHKDGHIIWVRINGSPIFDSGGKFLGSVGMHTDITAERSLREQLEDYARTLIQIQEEERKRIARELHDDTAPTLSYLSLELDAIIARSKNLSEENIRHLKDLREKINNTQENIRRFSHELHPSILDNIGLEAALEALADELNSKGKVEVEFIAKDPETALSDDVKLALYRITQEALNNVWKHAQATKAVIRLEHDPDNIKLSIADNGKGFDSTGAKSGLGLTGMRERANLIGANLKIDSQVGKGTTITVSVGL